MSPARENKLFKYKNDLLMLIAGGTVFLAFLMITYASIFMKIDSENFTRAESTVGTLTGIIIGYFFRGRENSKLE